MKRSLVPWIGAVLLAGAVLVLRGPSLSVPLWNVDEAIHAAVARTLLHGGTLYRDAIDQRTPLSYGAVAGMFAVFGENHLVPVRGLVALLIGATGFALWRLGRRLPLPAAGAWAAGVFVALTTGLLTPADAFAAHTEWFAIVFTTLGAWWFCRYDEAPGFVPALGIGAVYALAFLSKQPTLLDFGAPLAAAAWLGVTGRWRAARSLRTIAALVTGYAGTVGGCALWFAAQGALADGVFYTWTYNLRYYGPDATWAGRWAAAWTPLQLLGRSFPWALVLLGGFLAVGVVRLLQLRPDPLHRPVDRWFAFLVTWCALALAGAASGGRDFEHYTIQCLPPFALALGWALAAAWRWAQERWQRGGALRLAGGGGGLALVAAGMHLAGQALVHSRPEAPPPDPALRVAAYVRAHTAPDETIFVWGFNPDIYLYANRRPASRFVYCSFLTGLIPWTNLDPRKDTAYAIVPGTLETLLADLAARRPAAIIDCSPGPHRFFDKYPIGKFPALARFLKENYAVAEAPQFEPQGFRLHLIRDRFRATALPLAGGTGPGTGVAPTLDGPARTEAAPTAYQVAASDPAGRLQKLELRVNGTAVDGISFAPAASASAALMAPFDRIGHGTHQVTVRSTLASGRTVESAAATVVCGTSLDATQRAAFAVPVATAELVPISVDAPFNPRVYAEGLDRIYFLHTPSQLIFALPGDCTRLRGAFGITPAAFAPENPAPTDGANFQILLVPVVGRPVVLLDQLLQPTTEVADRPPRRFDLDLPDHQTGDRLELRITNGPRNNGACDWTFWSNLEFSTTRR